MVASLGLFIALASSLIQSLKALSMKHNLKSFDSNCLVFLLSLGTVILLLPVMFYIGFPTLSFKFWIVFFVSGSLYYIGKYFHFRALQAEEISYIHPLKGFIVIGVVIVSFLLLGEFPSYIGFIGIFFILIGVYFINLQKFHQNFFDPFRYLISNYGARLYLVTIFCYSFTAVLDKIGVIESSPIFWTFMMNIFLLVMSSKGFYNNFSNNKKIILIKCHWILITLFLYLIGHITQMIAIKMILVSYVISFKTGGIIFTIILGGLLFKEKDLKKRALMGCFIVIGTLLILLF